MSERYAAPNHRRYWQRGGIVLLLLTLGLLVTVFVEEMAGGITILTDIPWRRQAGPVLLHFSLLGLMFLSLITGWSLALAACDGALAHRHAAGSWLLSNLGKYLPGKLFMFAGRMVLCTRLGIRKSACAWALTTEHLFLLLATSPFLLLLMLKGFQPRVTLLYALTPLLLSGLILLLRPTLAFRLLNDLLRRVGRAPLPLTPSPGHLLALLCLYLLTWLLYGLSGAVLCEVLQIETTLPLLQMVAVFVVAWLIGFLSLLPPGGLGVREATLVFLLQPQVAVPEAIALAVLARATWTTVELGGVAVGLWLERGWVSRGAK